ncbi:MBL fold metallo-hydrolase [Conexibacter stalactiti]|uniref:MBL fold metallo-hydrolase n=1 Tax=Conexibacter stalactiti TaxID=1940611 RepID=A0ABU4HUG9_9ACTN|nr:MBL fold metallo-hydrolase [Conexibacter stalactiti]MDW5596474.1 MBL fold metallo-hydrolase [Conexibacter stalactiti]MEC5037116.1 MBL fold metallo-hydrolase [Conexibacter stalactiti]
MELLARHDVVVVRADNPGPFTLTGTNSWIVGRDPAWVIDPGPALPDHLDALERELSARGGLGGIALTHDHPDHAEAVPALRERCGPAPLAAARAADLLLADCDAAGPMTTVATPGHSPDHLAYLVGPIAFSGDVVLGQGSTLLIPDPGALRGYLAGLERLRARRPELIAPGHGPLVTDPLAKLDEYIAHRLERERMVVDALAQGLRTVDELLAAAWPDAPKALRMAATVTLAAHLDKLAEEGRLPDGVERPPWPLPLGRVGQP